MARVTAGLALPPAMVLSVVLTMALLDSQPGLGAAVVAVVGRSAGPAGSLAGLLSLTAAHFLCSALAIRFGRVVLTLFLLVGGECSWC